MVSVQNPSSNSQREVYNVQQPRKKQDCKCHTGFEIQPVNIMDEYMFSMNCRSNWMWCSCRAEMGVDCGYITPRGNSELRLSLKALLTDKWEKWSPFAWFCKKTTYVVVNAVAVCLHFLMFSEQAVKAITDLCIYQHYGEIILTFTIVTKIKAPVTYFSTNGYTFKTMQCLKLGHSSAVIWTPRLKSSQSIMMVKLTQSTIGKFILNYNSRTFFGIKLSFYEYTFHT